MTVGDYADADLVVVNTCGFIDDAVAESLDAIGECACRERQRWIVTGCLGAKTGRRLHPQHPSEGARRHRPHAPNEVMDAVPPHLPETASTTVHRTRSDHGVKLTPKHYAYLKIPKAAIIVAASASSCRCAGDLVSRPIGEVMREAESLVKSGVKELRW